MRVVGTDGAPAQQPTGRVEMFYNKKWGTVCNKGWTDESADVTCKQLGFTAGGKAVGSPGQFKACIIGKEDFCEAEGKELIAENLKCTGKEKKVIECGGKFPAQCSHFQSAMVKCNGSDGDTSG